MTPLSGSSEAVMALLDAHARHPTAPEKLQSALLTLIEAGACPNPDSGSERSAARFAARLAVTPYFLALALSGATLKDDVTPDSGFTVLHDLARHASDKDEPEALACAALLTERLGVDKAARSAIGLTARDMAVQAGSRLLAPWLAYGKAALLDTEDGRQKLATRGQNAWEAAAKNDVEALKALAALGELTHAPALEGPHEGLTPLSVAAERVALKAMAYLLQSGASPTERINARARGGRATEGTSALARLLFAPASPTTLPEGLTIEDWRAALALMASSAQAANAPVDADERTPLLFLAQHALRGLAIGDADWPALAARELLAAGAEVDRPMTPRGVDLPFIKTPGGITPLGLAVMAGERGLPLVRVLLEAGADPNAGDRLGVTPLMRAADVPTAHAAQALSDCLIAAGAEPARLDAAGQSAIDRAAAAGYDALVAAWLAAAPPEPLDSTTPLDDVNALLALAQGAAARAADAPKALLREKTQETQRDERPPQEKADFFTRLKAKRLRDKTLE